MNRWFQDARSRPLALAPLLLAFLLPLAACGDRPDADVDFGGSEVGSDLHAITSDDGAVKLGLTEEVVYFALADSVIEEARAEMRTASEQEGIEGFFGGLVERTAGRALSFRARFPIEGIEDIRWENDRMRIVFVDSDQSIGDHFKVDDRPVEEAFREEDVREFAEAFRQVKTERSGN